jgi:hypothetical protein
MLWAWPSFIDKQVGATIHYLIIMGPNYIMVDIPSESSIEDSGFIITLCPIPSVLLERLHI